MDPLTALSVAGAAIQFTDFAIKILATGHELYNSPKRSSAANEEIERTTLYISHLVAKIQRSSNQDGRAGELTGDKQSLSDICGVCVTIANEILKRLEGLKVKGDNCSIRRVLQAALRQTWEARELQSLAKRLERIKSTLQFDILISLQDEFDTMAVQQSDRFSKLDDKTQIIISALLDSQKASADERQDQAAAISQMLNHTEVVIADEHDKTRCMIIDAIRLAGVFKDKEGDLDDSSELQLVAEAREFEQRLRSEVEDAILHILYYPSMLDRFSEVSETHGTTFEWIFRTQNEMKYNFLDWLETGTGIYWINGKAGSGKSTLMRYICEHLKTKQNLRRWAGQKSLATACHFFWIDGVADQKSQSGLLRSLLYQTLSQYQDLIPVVLPWLWATKYSELRDSLYKSTQLQSLSLSKLKEAFGILVHQNAIDLRMCLFVDGLDEYRGNHGEIADVFEIFTRSPNCKICISSRPLLVFEEVFGKSPQLRLQDLTYMDVQTYVKDNLSSNRRYQALATREQIRAPKLVQEIVQKADGVFLWVKLVVQSLLDGLGNRDEISDLQRRLKLLPPDLEALYQHILRIRTDPVYLEKMSMTLQIIREAREVADDEPLTIISMNLALYDYEASDQMIASLSKSEIKTKVESTCSNTEERLRVWCAGLVEVTGTQTSNIHTRKVQYLHRSVKDYLDRPEVWESTLSCTNSIAFDPSVSLLRSFVLQFKGSLSPQIPSAGSAPWYLKKARIEKSTMSASILDELDHILESQVKWTGLGRPEHWVSPFILGETIYYGRHIFIALAIQMRWYDYVEEKLEKDVDILKKKTGRPLLDYALTTDRERTKQYCADQRMIRILFKYGATPSDCFDRPIGITSWEKLMHDTYKWCHDKQFLQNQYGIIKTFLLHSADQEKLCRTPDGPLSAQSIIQKAFQEWYTSEAVEVERLLK